MTVTRMITRRLAIRFPLLLLLAFAPGCEAQSKRPALGAFPDANSEGPAAKPQAAAAAVPKPAANPVPGWYQWRGPEQNGVSRETNLPETWDPETGENVVWQAPVGGMSSPVVWN